MTTGQRIRAARKKAGMTQAELAEKLEIPFQSVSQWERDIRNPKKETLERLANVFGCYYFELYGDDESKEVAALMEEGMRLGINAKNGLTRMEFLAEYQEQGYSFDPEEIRLVSAFNKLNLNGQGFVITMTESMAKIPHYMQEQVQPQEPPQSPQTQAEGADTATTEPPPEEK